MNRAIVARQFNEKKLVIATHNRGKLKEISELVGPLGINVITPDELSIPEPVENGSTFIENAKIKAWSAVINSGKTSLSDDSGLVVPALNGAPGIYSARWAGPGKNFTAAMARLNKELGDKDRRAFFVAALVLLWPDGHMEAFEGTVHGMLVWPPRGNLGFGYDPMFLPNGKKKTFGEFTPSEKQRYSHRSDAFDQLAAACFSERNQLDK